MHSKHFLCLLFFAANLPLHTSLPSVWEPSQTACNQALSCLKCAAWFASFLPIFLFFPLLLFIHLLIFPNSIYNRKEMACIFVRNTSCLIKLFNHAWWSQKGFCQNLIGRFPSIGHVYGRRHSEGFRPSKGNPKRQTHARLFITMANLSGEIIISAATLGS